MRGTNTSRIRQAALRLAAVFCLLLGFATDGNATPLDRAQQCALQFCYLAAGVPCFAERAVHDLIRIPISVIFPRLVYGKHEVGPGDAAPFAFTSRGPIEYADLAGLYTYDFRNKKVLDIAGGSGRFAQVVNAVFGHTGTQATVLDLYANAPWLFPGKTPRVKADAFSMPFEDKAFDLTVNNWMAAYYIGGYYKKGDLSDPVEGPKARKYLETLLYEQIRVTADGGTARIGMGVTYRRVNVQTEMLSLTQHLLQNHPRVESVEFIFHVPAGHSINVKLKADSSGTTAPSAFHTDPHFRVADLKPVPWKVRGLAVMPGLFAGTVAWATWRRYGPQGDENEELVEALQADMRETEEELRKQIPDFAFVVADPPRRGHEREDLQNMRRTLTQVRALVKHLPKEKLKRFQLLMLKHDPAKSEQSVTEDLLLLHTDNPDLSLLLKQD